MNIVIHYYQWSTEELENRIKFFEKRCGRDVDIFNRECALSQIEQIKTELAKR